MSPAESSLKSLYKSLLRQANQFPQYNFRNYALRKIKYEFSTTLKSLTNPEEINKFVEQERGNLEQLKRMVKVQSLYCPESSKLVIESKENK